MRCCEGSFRLEEGAGFSFFGCEQVESVRRKGEDGRLPRMACRARQLEREMSPPGLGGGGVEVDGVAWWG